MCSRELAATNSELRQIIRELEGKYLEFCQAPSMPTALRKTAVREVYIGQEQELAESRKTLKVMQEQLHELQQKCYQAEIEANPAIAKAAQAPAPPHKSVLKSVGDYHNHLNEQGPGMLGGSSRAAAASIVVYEVRRLRNHLMQAKEEVKALKKQVRLQD